MLKNYLKVALRNLTRQKTYAFINIGGLAVGLACCLLLGLFIRHELSYDRFHENADRIVRLVPDYHYQGNVSEFSAIGAPWGPALVAAFPEVEQAVRFRPMRNTLVRRDDHIAYERGGLYADSTIFEVFSFPLVQGNPQTALHNPNSVVLTEQMAARFFGADDPMGQTLTIEREDYIVTGIAQDVPEASHFDFNFLLPFAKHAAARPDQVDRWGLYNYFVYLLLDRPGSIAGLEAKFPDFEERNLGQESALRVVARLQPLTSIYLHSNRGNELGPTGNITTLSMLGAIALFILLIACINFMNLATARSANRAREVGVRKAVGAQRGQLAFQFLAEAMLVCFFALLMALLLAELLLPAFNALTGKSLATAYLHNAPLLLGVAGLGLVVGVLAGSYPAFYLSSFRPVAVLKGIVRTGRSASRLRRGLVVVQFTLSIVLIASVGVVYQQLHFMQTKDLGLDTEQVVVFPMRDDAIIRNMETFKDALLRTPHVEQVAISSGNIAGGDWGSPMRVEDGTMAETQAARVLFIDETFLPTMDLDLVAGRNLSPDLPTDREDALIINEAAARVLGLDDPVGQRLNLLNWRKGTVVGVVSDFHFRSLHEAITPLVMFYNRDNFYFFSVRIRTDRVAEALAAVEDTWHTFAPDRPFEYSFLDDSFAWYYRNERRLSTILSTFAVLAIFIACLGLLGLASFAAEQRRKEVGIRKVMGATVSNIVVLLSKDFTRLVVLAFVLAAPLAYLLMDRWLQAFAYRIEIGLGPLLLAGIAALLIALLTVSYQSTKAALVNPVESLRHE